MSMHSEVTPPCPEESSDFPFTSPVRVAYSLIDPAFALYEQDNYANALPVFEAIRHNIGPAIFMKNPHDPQSASLLLPAWIGLCHLNLGDPEAALSNFSEANSLKPNNPHVHFLAGVSMMDMDDPRQAFRAFRAADKLAPDTPDILGLMAQTLNEAGRYKAAISVVDRALSLDPGNPLHLNTMGVALGRAGRNDAALSYFRRAVRRAPEDSILRNNLGVAWMKSSSPYALRNAEKHLSCAMLRAPRSSPIYSDGHIALAEVAFRRGRNGDALESLCAAYRSAALQGPASCRIVFGEIEALSERFPGGFEPI